MLHIAKMTGVSRAQVARLIPCYRQGGAVKRQVYRTASFPQPLRPHRHRISGSRGRGHETLSGQATQKRRPL